MATPVVTLSSIWDPHSPDFPWVTDEQGAIQRASGWWIELDHPDGTFTLRGWGRRHPRTWYCLWLAMVGLGVTSPLGLILLPMAFWFMCMWGRPLTGEAPKLLKPGRTEPTPAQYAAKREAMASAFPDWGTNPGLRRWPEIRYVREPSMATPEYPSRGPIDPEADTMEFPPIQ